MRPTEGSTESKIKRGLEAERKELMRRRIVYVLVCEDRENRVAEGSDLAEWRREKKVRERQRRDVAYRERQKTSLW